VTGVFATIVLVMLIMLVRMDLVVIMADFRTPISRILPLHFGVVVFRGVMPIHVHEGGSLQLQDGNALGLRLVDPDIAILIVILAVALVVIDAVAGIINVGVGDRRRGHNDGRVEGDREALGLCLSAGFGQQGQEDRSQQDAAFTGFMKMCLFNHDDSLPQAAGWCDGVLPEGKSEAGRMMNETP